MISEFISDNKKHFCLIYIEVNTKYQSHVCVDLSLYGLNKFKYKFIYLIVQGSGRGIELVLFTLKNYYQKQPSASMDLTQLNTSLLI